MGRSQVGLHVVGLGMIGRHLAGLHIANLFGLHMTGRRRVFTSCRAGRLVLNANLLEILCQFREHIFSFIDSTLPRLVQWYLPLLLEFRLVRRNELFQFILEETNQLMSLLYRWSTHLPSQLFRQLRHTDIRFPLPKEVPCLVLEAEAIVPPMASFPNRFLVDQHPRTVVRNVVNE
jgi:hypothetical protein